MHKGAYFKQVTEYPTRLGENDVLLKFNMTSLKGHRAPHPGYFPGAILTLTIWIWVNGPIFVDTFDVAGDLVIVDRDGKELATAKEQVKLERNVGLYGREYWAPTMGAKQLSELVSQLLDTATSAAGKTIGQGETHDGIDQAQPVARSHSADWLHVLLATRPASRTNLAAHRQCSAAKTDGICAHHRAVSGERRGR